MNEARGAVGAATLKVYGGRGPYRRREQAEQQPGGFST